MAKMRKKKANKMKLSERVKNLPPAESPAEVEVIDQPEVTQPVKSSTAAAKASVERDNSAAAVKLIEASTDAQQDAIEVDKKLLKAVNDLTKTMQFGYKRQQEEKKKGLAGYVQGKISSVKSAFSLEGMAGMAGVQRDSGTLAGAVLGSVLQRKEKKQEEAAKKAEFIAKFGEFTEIGRQIKETGGMEAVTAEGEKRFKQLSEAEKDISELEERKKQAKMIGGTLSKSDTERLVAAKKLKRQATDYSINKKPEEGNKEELLAGVAEGVKAEISTLSDEEKETISKADPEYLKGIFEGALGSLTDINEKQLEQLVALVKASTVSEEDKLEAKNKENIVASVQDPKEDKKKEEEGGGMMKSIMNMFGNFRGMLKNIPGMLMGALKGIGGRLFGGAAKLAAPILGAGKAIVGGASKAIPMLTEVGSKAAGVAGKVMPAITGGAAKAAELASTKIIPAITGGAAKIAGGVLPAAAEIGTKAAGIGTKMLGGLSGMGGIAKGILGKAGPLAMAGMAAYDAYSGYNEAAANLGIEGREATTGEKLSSAAGGALSGLTFGLVGKDTASKGIASFFGAGPDVEKPETPNRVAQAVELAKNKEQLEQTSKEMTPAVNQPIVTNAPTTIINKSTNTSVRAPIRNTDPSYNNRLSRNFVY